VANSKRRCRWCKSYGSPEDGKIINGAFYCSLDHAIAYGRYKAPKAIQKAHRAERAAYRRDDKPHQIELTQKAFNGLIRALDAGKTCPTCGQPLVDGSYDAGHVRTVASCPALRFDARACFGQCRSCNGSGTIRKRTRKGQDVVSALYKAWILDSFGQAYHDWLYGPHEAKHYSVDYLIEFRKLLLAEARRIKSGLPSSRDWRSLPD